MSNMTLEPFQYFYVLIAKPVGYYFQSWSPYYQAAQCNQKTFQLRAILKESLITANNFIHNFDIICVSDTFLNSEIFPIARGSICIFYKARLPLRVLNISNLNECINFDVSIAYKICYLIHLNRSSSQTQHHFKYSDQIMS